MDWQQATALSIVAATSIMMGYRVYRKRASLAKGECDADCGCVPGDKKSDAVAEQTH